MKSSVSILAILLGAVSAAAVPTTNNTVGFPLEEREGSGDGIVSLVEVIEALIANDKNAYDDDIPHNCVIYTQTYAGSQCKAAVYCDGNWQDGYGGTGTAATLVPGGGNSWYDTWEVCYLNGRQYMTHPTIGDFSITFTEAGGVNSDQDGLHTPVFQFAMIGPNTPINAQEDADKDESSGHLCDYQSVAGTQVESWWCGVPQIGYSNFGLTNTPATQSTYVPGWCGIHFIEYQIPSGGTHYSFAMRIVDNDGNLIGQVGNSYEVNGDNVDATDPVDVDSALPYVVIATVAKPGSSSDPDAAPVQFAYAGQFWNSSSPQCSIGGYDSGSRQGDCGFSCPAS